MTNVATSYLLLTPFNFNDNDVSLSSLNSVLINRPEKKRDNETLPGPLPGPHDQKGDYIVDEGVVEGKCKLRELDDWEYSGGGVRLVPEGKGIKEGVTEDVKGDFVPGGK